MGISKYHQKHLIMIYKKGIIGFIGLLESISESLMIHHLKISTGGTRSFGTHDATMGPDHAVGAYYFLIKTRGFGALPDILRRMIKSVVSKHHLRRPWWLFLTPVAEFRGLIWSCLLYRNGPSYIHVKN